MYFLLVLTIIVVVVYELFKSYLRSASKGKNRCTDCKSLAAVSLQEVFWEQKADKEINQVTRCA